MKIVQKLPGKYNAIQFDMSFVKRYGLIKYPMVALTTQIDGHGPITKYSERVRDDFWGRVFGAKETIKCKEYDTKAHEVFIIQDYESGKAEALKDGYWIVTNRFGKSKAYSPTEFKKNFERTTEL